MAEGGGYVAYLWDDPAVAGDEETVSIPHRHGLKGWQGRVCRSSGGAWGRTGGLCFGAGP